VQGDVERLVPAPGVVDEEVVAGAARVLRPVT
jgi:hypothetical protein